MNEDEISDVDAAVVAAAAIVTMAVLMPAAFVVGWVCRRFRVVRR